MTALIFIELVYPWWRHWPLWLIKVEPFEWLQSLKVIDLYKVHQYFAVLNDPVLFYPAFRIIKSLLLQTTAMLSQICLNSGSLCNWSFHLTLESPVDKKTSSPHLIDIKNYYWFQMWGVTLFTFLIAVNEAKNYSNENLWEGVGVLEKLFFSF